MSGGEAVIQAAVDSFGKLDILVNCAGIVRDRMIYQMTEGDWDRVITNNLKGPSFPPALPVSCFANSGAGASST